MITGIEHLEMAEEIIKQAKEDHENGIQVDVECEAVAHAALLREDPDGTQHYDSTGEVDFTLKITTLRYKPLCQK